MVFTVWPFAVRRIDWTTREITTITEYNAWHIAPDRRGERILCDTNHPDDGLPDHRCRFRRAAAALSERGKRAGDAVVQVAIRPGGGFRGGVPQP